jgi:DNA modification methylase
MEIKSKEILIIDINKIVPNPKNPNKHPKEQIERLSSIIDFQGFRQPLIVSNRSGFLVAGHGRLEIAKLKGVTQLPVMYQDFDSEAQEYAFCVADNEIARWAQTDLSMVNTDMLDLGPDFDIDMLGIKDFVLEPIEKFEPQSDEDAVPEVVHPITRKGDLWLLGKHRLLCGDSAMIDDVEKLMNGEKADMVYTDPPYGMFLKTDFSSMDGLSPEGKSFLGTSGGKKHKPVKGDSEDFNPEFISNIFTCFDYCKEVFLWGADYYSEYLINKNDGAWIVWDKRTNEGASEDQALSADRLFGSSFELCWARSKHKREIARIRNGIFGVKNESGNSKTVHPTQKPVQLAEWFFEKWGSGAKLVADIFAGSGSTLIACEKTNRICHTLEFDEGYCDVIIKRWEAFTGKKATLELTGQTYEELKAERDGETN